jgi:hypothetical protein
LVALWVQFSCTLAGELAGDWLLVSRGPRKHSMSESRTAIGLYGNVVNNERIRMAVMKTTSQIALLVGVT